MDVESAMDLGREVLTKKMYPDVLEDIMSDYSTMELKGFRAGLLQSMLDRIGEITPTGNTGNVLTGKRRLKQLIEKGLQDPEAFEELITQAMREQNKSRVHTRLLNNSITSAVESGDRMLPVEQGSAVGILRQVIERVMKQEMTPAEWHEVAKIMTGELSEEQIDRLFTTRLEQRMSNVPEILGTGTAIGIGQAAGRVGE
jgi:hypothetical protein